MRSVTVAVAGHVDHGKTSLVKALTGIDTDSLPEEKARKLTIETGFAPLLLEDDFFAVFADLPGHEHFIGNMIAGCAVFNLAVLVVAANEGIMPQTIEHIDIISALRDSYPLVVVITKTDLAAPDVVESAIVQVADFLISKNISEFYIRPFSARTLEGLCDILGLIRALAEKTCLPSSSDAFRMHVARVFSVKGAGVVVTGHVASGSVRKGDRFEIFPGFRSCAAKNIQRCGIDVEEASVGATLALNIKGIKRDNIYRGMTIVQPERFAPVSRASFICKNVSSSILEKTGEFLVYLGTSKVLSKLKFHNRILPGESGPASVIFRKKLICIAGDRVLVRSLNPPETIGGGTIFEIFSESFDTFALNEKKTRVRIKTPLLNRILKVVELAGLRGIAFGTVADLTGKDIGTVRRHAVFLSNKLKIKICGNFLVSLRAYDELKRQFIHLLNTGSSGSISDMRNIISAGRHFLVAVLEEFDRESLTVRTESGRRLL